MRALNSIDACRPRPKNELLSSKTTDHVVYTCLSVTHVERDGAHVIAECQSQCCLNIHTAPVGPGRQPPSPSDSSAIPASAAHSDPTPPTPGSRGDGACLDRRSG